MKPSYRIWITATILVLAIFGVAAGMVSITNHQGKIQVQRDRLAAIHSAIKEEMERAKVIVNKPLPNELTSDSVTGANTIDANIMRRFLEKQTRAFNFCEEEVLTLNSQRRQNEEGIYGLMESVNDSTILAVACAILGLYAVFWIQRYT